MKLLNLLDIQKYVKSCAAKANMSVVYEDTPVPYCTPGCVHLPDINRFTTDEQLASYLYFIEHETAHAEHSDFDATKAYQHDTTTGRVINLLEDYRIDTIDCRKYDGFRINRSDVIPAQNREVGAAFREMLANKAASEHVEEAERLVAGLAWSTLHDNDPNVVASADALLVNDNVKAIVAKLEKYTHELEDLVNGTTHDAAELGKRIVREVFGQDPEQDKKPQEGGKEGQGNGGDKEGDGKGKGKGKGEKGEGDGEGKDGESKEGKGKGKDKSLGGFGNHFDHETGVPQGVAMKHNYAPTVTRDIRIGGGHGKWNNCLPEQYIIADLSGGVPAVQNVWRRSGYGDMGVEYGKAAAKSCIDEVRAIKAGTVDGFAQQVRRLLQIRARSRYEYGQKRGKLDQSRLSRIGMRDAPGFNERIFKNKIVADTVNTAVMVLLDASGSMSGSKWAHAAKSGQLLNATVSRALGIPLEILAFTDYNEGTVIYEGKRFNQLRVGDDEILERLSLAVGYMSGNADGEAVLFAYNRLKDRREKRKVLIVVSDGAPAASRSGSIREYTKEVVESIEADHAVDIYGLGLMSTAVSRFYTKHVIVNHGDSLEQALLTLIDKSIS